MGTDQLLPNKPMLEMFYPADFGLNDIWFDVRCEQCGAKVWKFDYRILARETGSRRPAVDRMLAKIKEHEASHFVEVVNRFGDRVLRSKH